VLLLGAAVLAPAGWVHADSGQTASQNHAPAAKSASDDDAALMEFLGGIGSEDDAWIDYLARTDPTKIAAQPKKVRSEMNKPSDPPRVQADSSNGSQKQ